MGPTFRSGAAAAKHPMKCMIAGLVRGVAAAQTTLLSGGPRRGMEGGHRAGWRGATRRDKDGCKDGNGGMKAQGLRAGVRMGRKEASKE